MKKLIFGQLRQEGMKESLGAQQMSSQLEVKVTVVVMTVILVEVVVLASVFPHHV